MAADASVLYIEKRTGTVHQRLQCLHKTVSGLPEAGSMNVSGDCFQCQKCIDTCPRANIHCGLPGIKGNEVIFTIIRALILLGLFIWLGI